MKSKDKFLVALDAGSTKTCALVAEVNAEGLVFRALGRAESRGWRRGLIVNLEAAIRSIRQAADEAEQALGAPIEHVVVGLGASQVKGMNSRGGVPLARQQREIHAEDVLRAQDVAGTLNLPREVVRLHVLPQEFAVDSQGEILNPLGMVGARLDVNVHVITASAAAQGNLVTCVNRAALSVDEAVFEPLAAAEAVLNADERELGVVLADIGGGSTDCIVFRHGVPQHSFTIPIGGDHVTNDIAVGLRTPIPDAERIKRSFGVATRLLAGENTSIEVPSVGDRPSRLVPQRTLAEILEPRAQELLGLIRDELRRAGLDRQMGAGAVLTGGGARLAGLCDVAEDIFEAPARIGLPKLNGAPDLLAHPCYAALVGLLSFAQRCRQRAEAAQPGFFARFKAMVAGRA